MREQKSNFSKTQSYEVRYKNTDRLMKKDVGITLVALVVTIVILLILAGVSINLVLGNNGIIDKAKKAKNNTAQTTASEEQGMSEISNRINEITEDNNKGNPSTGDKDDDNKHDGQDEKDLTLAEKIEKIKKATKGKYIFDVPNQLLKVKNNELVEVQKEETDIKEAVCECGKVKEIFDKAVEMGLVETYTKEESQEGTDYSEVIVAPIKEPSFVFYDFVCKNGEQKPGGNMPMAFSLNYAITTDFKTWYDSGRPNFHNTGGDTENALEWVNQDYVQTGFVAMQARTRLYFDKTLTELGQVYHQKIQVVSQTNFIKAMKALNLDLSKYEGICVHPAK